jgi:hypothetical protein
MGRVGVHAAELRALFWNPYSVVKERASMSSEALREKCRFGATFFGESGLAEWEWGERIFGVGILRVLGAARIDMRREIRVRDVASEGAEVSS